uniref:tRNA(Ile)-lysidine synthase n=1 Tax=Gronococcus sybilensis TaxID=3028029 RepID=A0A9Y1I2I4_9RHOD|nr:tRNA(Ile)-lysidine synthetase [Gronococcus sybilensis]
MIYTQIHKIFSKFLRQEISINTSNNIILALSGGQDSMALFKLLKDYQKICYYNFHAVYCDHKYREDAVSNAAELNYLAQYSGINFHYYRVNKVLCNESEGRIWRYKILLKLASYFQPSKLLLAHTLTDKVETFMHDFLYKYFSDSINLLLPVFYAGNNVHLLRPLITNARSNTLWLCQISFLPIWSDYTNYSLLHPRNKVRHELLPYIKNSFNVQIISQIGNSIGFWKLQSLYVDSLVINLLRATVKYGKNKTIFKTIFMRELPLILQYQLLRNFLFYSLGCTSMREYTEYILCKIYLDQFPLTITYNKYTIRIDKDYIYCYS